MRLAYHRLAGGGLCFLSILYGGPDIISYFCCMCRDVRLFTVSVSLRQKLFSLLCVTVMGCCCISCAGDSVADEVLCRMADSLNTEAYRWRYRDIKRSQACAEQARELSSAAYPDGRVEALNHLVYVSYQQMDFDKARAQAREVMDASNNQIECLAADVMMMKICQRTSSNQQFYMHRNSALRRMNRIEEERHTLSQREAIRLLSVTAEFRFVSSTYYYYLDQTERSQYEMRCLDADELFRYDRAQWLYYQYMMGSGGMVEAVDSTTIVLQEFDYLFTCWTQSMRGGYLYFSANSLQSLATLLDNPYYRETIRYRRPSAYAYLEEKMTENMPLSDDTDGNLSMRIARRALEQFTEYDDAFQTACAYRTLGELCLSHGEYEQALTHFMVALSYVNNHHLTYYGDDGRFLLPFADDGQTSVEVQWMNDPNVQTVPEWIAGIREEMSMAFSGLNDKRRSDYNRNIYLDLLEYTRQDRELENRYVELETDARTLTWLLVAVVLALLLLAGILLGFAIRWKRRNGRQIMMLRHTLDACRRIMSVSGADNEQTDVLMPDGFTPKERNEMLAVLAPYRRWAERNRDFLKGLDDERQSLQDDKAISEQRIAENKRKQVENRARMSLVHGIVPFLDRIVNEIHRLQRSPENEAERLQYVTELVEQINVYNDILSGWIRLKQGELSLHVENFPLQPLLDVVKKSRQTFEQQGIALTVRDSGVVVRGDRTLTLFMLNTLADNARKFTPQGGEVIIGAEEREDAVEISVTDTGYGMQPEDLRRILDHRIYDARSIGTDRDETCRRKGHGFGLMNCKGIIDKYRKTHSSFSVCAFLIESEPGKGSRFAFRLPYATRRTLYSFMALLTLSVTSCSLSSGHPSDDTVTVGTQPVDTAVWQRAAVFCDSLYDANIRGDFVAAMNYSDSVRTALNVGLQACRADTLQTRETETALPGDRTVELLLWQYGVHVDYGLMLAWRNETAIAALALHRLDLYRYNNRVYRQLYRLLCQDPALETDCKRIEASQVNKRIGLAVLLTLVVLSVLFFYVFFLRRRVLFRLNMRQVLDVNNELLNTLQHEPESGGSSTPVEEMLNIVWRGLDEIHALAGLRLHLHDSDGTPIGVFAAGECTEALHLAEDTMRAQHTCKDTLSSAYAHPLLVEETDGGQRCIGALLFFTEPDGWPREQEQLFDELVTRYFSVLLYLRVVRRRQEYNDLELAGDERRRARYEEGQLYIQNQILDNCLSTIKHESMFYPSRIRLLAEKLLQTAGDNATQRRQAIDDLTEVVDYYKQIYTLLSAQADRQLAVTNFRRRPCPVDGQMAFAQRYWERRCNRLARKWSLAVDNRVDHAAVTGDEALLSFLLENLMQAALQRSEGEHEKLTFRWELTHAGDFIRFAFTDPRELYTSDELAGLFYPDLSRITYLLCKQIVREHDTFTNHRGCRINAEPSDDGAGYRVWFTLPKTH